MKACSLFGLGGGNDDDPSPTHVKGVYRFGVFDKCEHFPDGTEVPAGDRDVGSFFPEKSRPRIARS